ncbi:MAG: hypothetical protein WBB01_00300 [Phormidesmis sp.]
MTAIPFAQVAFASTLSTDLPADQPPTAQAEPVRHMLFGSQGHFILGH